MFLDEEKSKNMTDEEKIAWAKKKKEQLEAELEKYYEDKKNLEEKKY